MSHEPADHPWEPSSTLRHLAQDHGIEGDLGDEHVRWTLYQEALRRGVNEALLLVAEEDPDPVMATGLVLAALEQVRPEERDRWVAVARGWPTADLVAGRADALAVLDMISTADTERTFDATDIDGWSDWLQLRAAVPATHPAVLDALTRRGRTRRIRHWASDASRRRG